MGQNYISPWISVLRGQQVADGLSKSYEEGISLKEREALKRAAAAMGEQPDFAGFEGVPGAARPDYLRELYANGDPKSAMEMEKFLTPTLGVNRDIRKAGEVERVKKEADAEVYGKLFKEFMGSEGGQNAFGNMVGGAPASAPASNPNPDPYSGPTIPAVEAPEAPSVPGPRARAPLSNQSGVETTFEITPYGPKLGAKKMSPFDKELKASEDATRRQTADTGTAAEQRQTVQAAHDNVRKTTEEILATQKLMQNRDIPWEEGQARIKELKGQLGSFASQRDQLLKGKVPPTTPTPASAPVSAVAPVPESAPQFTEKEQANLAMENQKEKIAAANKEVVNARLAAEKIIRFKRQVSELFDLVTKQDIGHPAMEGIPLAENVLTLNRANAQVKKLTDGIINMFAEPGQSQMMNTIVERQMQGAVVPSIFSDPQINKKNAAILRSNIEHLQSFPGFLEKWKKNHDGTLDGATDAWIDYTENNPLYIFSTNPRGKVTVQENSHVTPWPQWLKMKEREGGAKTRKIGGRNFIQQSDGSWVEGE